MYVEKEDTHDIFHCTLK